ncbi:MAG: LysR family transcriptional regulator [Lachnospiraceae bacterium]|nr:LysR family transcriptional regulator [Lachnospiraceae bacterium]
MDLKRFEYLVTIAEHKSITKAAKALYISQSALSHYLQKVEMEVGTELFDRSATPITLTQAGKCYMESARKILTEHNQLEKEIRDITKHMTGTLTIGTSLERAAGMIPKIIVEFQKRYPGIEIKLLTKSAEKLKVDLREGIVDLLLFPHYGTEKEQGIASQKICEEELVLVAKKGFFNKEMSS